MSSGGLVCPASVLSLVMVSAVRCLLSSSMMVVAVRCLVVVETTQRLRALGDGLGCPVSVLSLVMVLDGWVSTLALVAVLVMVSVLVLGADRDSAVTACSR